MNCPRTYAEWSDLLDKLKQGTDDTEALQALESGTIEWTGGVAEKVTRLLSDVLEVRLQRTSQHLQNELNRSGGSESAIVAALMNARRRFGFLYRLCQLPAFPEHVKTSLAAILAKYVQDTQRALEDSAKGDRSGKLHLLIKNNSLLHYEQCDTAMPPQGEGRQAIAAASVDFTTKRRRVLFR